MNAYNESSDITRYCSIHFSCLYRVFTVCIYELVNSKDYLQIYTPELQCVVESTRLAGWYLILFCDLHVNDFKGRNVNQL